MQIYNRENGRSLPFALWLHIGFILLNPVRICALYHSIAAVRYVKTA